MTRTVTRDVSVDILRVILMSMIVVWHIMVYGLGINDCRNEGFQWNSNIYASLLCPFLCYHVNCFNFISGFYGISFKVKKIVVLYVMLMLFTFATYLIALYIEGGGGKTLNIRELAHDILCAYQNWWYMACYFMLLFIAPLINKSIECMNANTLRTFIVTYYVVLILPGMIYNQPTNMALFFFIYIVGRYLNKYNNLFIEKNAGKIFWGCITMLFLIRYVGWYFHNSYLYLQSISYNNPIVVIAGISFFYLFKTRTININTSLISKITPGILTVYLVSDSAYLRMPFNYSMVYIANGNIIVLCIMALIFTIIFSYFGGLLNKLLSFGYNYIFNR